MGASIQGRDQGRGQGGRKRRRLMNEINVTPMVDVMLVLLIIFMVTSPMMVAGIEVDLPQTESAPMSGNDNPPVIAIKQNEEIYLLETLVSRDDLLVKLKEMTKGNKEARIFVRGDKNVSYGKIMDLMCFIRNAGFTKAALITENKK